MYDASGTLLYIGISKSALGRLAQHLDTQPWADQVARVEIETHRVGRCTIESMERAAIIRERPLYNKAHNRPDERRPFRASDAFDHTWMHQFANEQYVTMQTGVAFALQAFGDLCSPGDEPHDIRKAWMQVLESAAYYDACPGRCDNAGGRFVLPFKRSTDGVCTYQCPTCRTVWTCWWS
jgi:hypothetical protein